MNTVAALLIVLTGAIPMNYLEAKQRLVEDSGHAELVVSSITGDFDDHAVAERPKAKNGTSTTRTVASRSPWSN
jgi:hypothetical protein